MSPDLIGTFSVGVALAGWILANSRSLRREIAQLRTESRQESADFQTVIRQEMGSVRQEVSALGQEVSQLRERMAHLEGHLSGLRDVFMARAE